MAQATATTYRILTNRQQPRPTWRIQALTTTHRVAYDPTVYVGTLFPIPPYAKLPSVDVVPTGLGHDLGLVRVSP